MTLHIELTPEQEVRLNAAAQQNGLAPGEILKKLVDEHLHTALPAGDEDPTLALFAQWEREDAQRTPEETAEEARLWEAFEKGINQSRLEQGMRQL